MGQLSYFGSRKGRKERKVAAVRAGWRVAFAAGSLGVLELLRGTFAALIWEVVLFVVCKLYAITAIMRKLPRDCAHALDVQG